MSQGCPPVHSNNMDRDSFFRFIFIVSIINSTEWNLSGFDQTRITKGPVLLYAAGLGIEPRTCGFQSMKACCALHYFEKLDYIK